MRGGSDDLDATAALDVDARGQFVVPGFVDMHAHPLELSDPSGALELMVAFGVTGYRQMSGSAELLRRRASGHLASGPARPALLALPGALLSPVNAGTASDASRTVREQAELGADFVKMGMVSTEVYPAAQEESNRLGIPLGGHLPSTTDGRLAAAAGLRFIEHLGPGIGVIVSCSADEEELRAALAALPRPKIPAVKLPFADKIFALLLSRIVVSPTMRTSPEEVAIMARAIAGFDEERARQAAAVFREHETWHCPTLIRERTNELGDEPALHSDTDLRYVSQKTLTLWRRTAKRFAALPVSTRATFRRLYALQLRLTKIFDEEGVPLLAGSDVTGASWEVPGAALHREFDELSEAGLSPLRILQLTTLEPARFLGRTEDLGQVAVGRSADLVLLSGDPTAAVANLHKISGVVRAGTYHSPADLDEIRRRIATARSGG